MRIKRRFKPDACVTKKDSCRLNLEDPFIDHEKKVVLATDGHVIVVLPVDLYEHDKGVSYVNREAFVYARKIAGRRQEEVEIEAKEGRVKDYGGEDATFTSRQDREVPKWRQAAVPSHIDDEGTVSVGLDVGLLNKLAQAFGTKDLILTIKDEIGGVTVRPMDYDRDFVPYDRSPWGIVMPKRFNHLPPEVRKKLKK